MTDSLKLTALGIRGIHFRVVGWGKMLGFHLFSGLAQSQSDAVIITLTDFVLELWALMNPMAGTETIKTTNSSSLGAFISLLRWYLEKT